MQFRFMMSFRDVEELLVARCIVVTYETVRQSCRKLGKYFANLGEAGFREHAGRDRTPRPRHF